MLGYTTHAVMIILKYLDAVTIDLDGINDDNNFHFSLMKKNKPYDFFVSACSYEDPN